MELSHQIPFCLPQTKSWIITLYSQALTIIISTPETSETYFPVSKKYFLFSLPELSPKCEAPVGSTRRRGSMDYCNSRLTSLRGTPRAVKVDFEEAVGRDEQEESEEAKLRQTDNVPVQAVEQVKTYIFRNSFFACFFLLFNFRRRKEF